MRRGGCSREEYPQMRLRRRSKATNASHRRSLTPSPSNRSYDERIDCSGKLIMPGLVNAHTHTPMTLFRGLAEGVSLLTLDGWYNTIRALELVMTPDMVPAAVEVACAEMIRTGTTTFADQYFHMDQVVPAVKHSGLRGA